MLVKAKGNYLVDYSVNSMVLLSVALMAGQMEVSWALRVVD